MTPSYASSSSAAAPGPSGGRRTGTFAGASVFVSRRLVAPEVFDAVHDALRLNGAEVFLMADPDRTGPLDFRVISSSSHERFADLKAKGCNLLGPQCILSCAKERRFLPKQGYTCCLAMDGVKILCSGINNDEKTKIEQLITAMGGLLQTNMSMDVDFVIAKDVLAPKYKWAVNFLKKPIVSVNWLEQCWIEHRVVPHEPYKILPFTGLSICTTKLDAVERKELMEIIVQNGGHYSATLSKQCTHLVANKPGGDKYVAAKRWGDIYIVDRRWVDQSVARRACLDERAFLICQVKSSLKEQQIPELDTASTPTLPQIRAQSMAASPAIRPRPQPARIDIEAIVEERMREQWEVFQAEWKAFQSQLQQSLAAERQAMQESFVATLAAERALWNQQMTSVYAVQGIPLSSMPTPLAMPIPPLLRSSHTPHPSGSGSNDPAYVTPSLNTFGFPPV